MVSRFISSALLFSLAIFFVDVSSVSASGKHLQLPRNRHHKLSNRLEINARSEVKPLRRRKTCNKPGAGTGTGTSAAVVKTTSSETPTPTTTSTSIKATPTKTTPVKGGSSSGGGGGGGGAGKPSNWPTETQAGAAPAATRTSAADPFLKELSKSYDNTNNVLYNTVYRGEMTYYGQGLGACGDTYDDNSFTAAVSKLLYDDWPGATAGEMNRNPICGPFVPGRKTLSTTGRFITAIGGQAFVNVGGDGLLNCDMSSQCHIPLTATVKHGGKSIQVKIVDRCEGCAKGDIDLTPAAFAALADKGLGRTDVEWSFNKY